MPNTIHWHDIYPNGPYFFKKSDNLSLFIDNFWQHLTVQQLKCIAITHRLTMHSSCLEMDICTLLIVRMCTNQCETSIILKSLQQPRLPVTNMLLPSAEVSADRQQSINDS
jgi:hypothetical protein